MQIVLDRCKGAGYTSGAMVARMPTSTQLAALRALEAFAAERGHPPTLADLAVRLGVSRSAVWQVVNALERLGLVAHERGAARTLRSLAAPGNAAQAKA